MHVVGLAPDEKIPFYCLSMATLPLIRVEEINSTPVVDIDLQTQWSVLSNVTD